MRWALKADSEAAADATPTKHVEEGAKKTQQGKGEAKAGKGGVAKGAEKGKKGKKNDVDEGGGGGGDNGKEEETAAPHTEAWEALAMGLESYFGEGRVARLFLSPDPQQERSNLDTLCRKLGATGDLPAALYLAPPVDQNGELSPSALLLAGNAPAGRMDAKKASGAGSGPQGRRSAGPNGEKDVEARGGVKKKGQEQVDETLGDRTDETHAGGGPSRQAGATGEAPVRAVRLEGATEAELAELEKRSEVFRRYLMVNLMPYLTKGMLEVRNTNPDDPIEFLADFLQQQGKIVARRAEAQAFLQYKGLCAKAKFVNGKHQAERTLSQVEKKSEEEAAY